MLWPLPVLATVIHGQLLFQVFWTPFSLTKNLLIYLLLPYTWRIQSHFLLLPLAPCLLTLQRFSSSLHISSLASRVPPDAILPQYLLSPPSLSSIACLYFGNWVSWSNASFTGRTHAQSLTPEGHLWGPWQIRNETSVFLSDTQSFSPTVPFCRSVIQTCCPGDSSSLQDPFFPGDNCVVFFLDYIWLWILWERLQWFCTCKAPSSPL